MSNWYTNIEIKLKNKKNSTSEILDYMNKVYEIESENININNEKIIITGDEADSIYKKNDPYYLPEVEEIFSELSKEYPECEYGATVSKESSASYENEEYFIDAIDKRLKIGMPPVATIIYLYDYNTYEDFCDYYGDIITIDDFNKLKSDNIEILYKPDFEDKVYTEEEYYNNIDYYFDKKIEDL